MAQPGGQWISRLNKQAARRCRWPKSTHAKSPSEERLKAQAEVAGFEILRDGWPDYTLIKDGKPLFVEVKQGPSQSRMPASILKPNQIKMLRFLESLGFDVRIARDGELNDLYTIDAWLKITGGMTWITGLERNRCRQDRR